MKKTIVILSIATLGLFGASSARAGVSFGIHLGLPVYAAPAPYCAPAPYVAPAPYCAPSVVVGPPAVYVPPVVVRPPFVHYGYGRGHYPYRGHYHHGQFHHPH